MGNSEEEFPMDLFPVLYNELNSADDEHTDVSLTHETEWCLSAFKNGLLIWENVAGEGSPKHMHAVSREKVIILWQKLALGKISEIEQEPWQTGYGQ
jgi:hypothetical protein